MKKKAQNKIGILLFYLGVHKQKGRTYNKVKYNSSPDLPMVCFAHSR